MFWAAGAKDGDLVLGQKLVHPLGGVPAEVLAPEPWPASLASLRGDGGQGRRNRPGIEVLAHRWL